MRGFARFGEQCEFIFEAGNDLETHARGFLEDVAQQRAGADRGRLAAELAEHEQALAVELAREIADRRRDRGHGHVRKSRVPAGHTLGIVGVERIVAVPADETAADTEPAGQSGQKVAGGEIFPAHDAVDIGDTKLHMAKAALLHQLRQFVRRIHVSFGHEMPYPFAAGLGGSIMTKWFFKVE